MSNNKNIAIFHNLPAGGAREYLKNISIQLVKLGYQIDLFTLKKVSSGEKNIYKNIYLSEIKQPENMMSFFIIYIKYLLLIKKIAHKINKNRYDIVLINQCSISYIYHEPKREFYEKVSVDHFSTKRTFSRILRYFLVYLEKININISINNICNSYYSREIFIKIFKKQPHVLYPFVKKIIKTKQANRHVNISTGITTYTKGHWFTEGMFINKHEKIEIITTKTETRAKQNNILYKPYISQKSIAHTLNTKKNFIANNINEPLGITTLDAINKKLLVFATNLGSHNELIQPGINGYLYPLNTNLAYKIFHKNKDCNEIKSTIIFKWDNYCDNLLKYIIK